MAQVVLNKTVPSIHHGAEKVRFTFSETILAGTGDVTVTPSQLLHGLLSMTPTATRTVTLPTANTLGTSITELTHLDVADAIPFIVRNQAAFGSGFNVVLAMGAGGTADSEANLITTPQTSHKYILRIDDANPASRAYTVFQVNSEEAGEGAAQVASVVADAAAATAGATTIASAGVAFELVGDAMGTGFTLSADGALSGISITGPNAAMSSTLTFAEAGNYLIVVTFAAQITLNAGAAPGVVEFALGLNAVVPTIPVGLISIDSESMAPDADSNVGTGSTIITAAAADVLNLYIFAASGVTDMDVVTPTLIRITAHKV